MAINATHSSVNMNSSSNWKTTFTFKNAFLLFATVYSIKYWKMFIYISQRTQTKLIFQANNLRCMLISQYEKPQLSALPVCLNLHALNIIYMVKIHFTDYNFELDVMTCKVKCMNISTESFTHEFCDDSSLHGRSSIAY